MEVRERTVLEDHLQEWLSPFWSLPVGTALAATAAAIVGDVTPAFDEGWRDKLARTRRASANARQALSDHNRVLGDAARRGQHRNSPDDDDAVD